jgi:ABC-type multidrug transport system permease subunit
MGAFYKIIISDYKQRTRSYAFLLTLAVSLYAAYSFVPAPGAAYTTLRVGNYFGVQNSAWIGYVTAMMSTVFLTFIGFYLVNSGIKKDVDTGVGMIVATTSISNFHYLLAKTISNFLVLLSIAGVVFLMGIVLFFVRSSGYPFELSQFILPYLLITVPVIFFISALAVVAEVFLYQFTIIMNIGYFFFFGVVSSLQSNTRSLWCNITIRQSMPYRWGLFLAGKKTSGFLYLKAYIGH